MSRTTEQRRSAGSDAALSLTSGLHSNENQTIGCTGIDDFSVRRVKRMLWEEYRPLVFRAPIMSNHNASSVAAESSRDSFLDPANWSDPEHPQLGHCPTCGQSLKSITRSQ